MDIKIHDRDYELLWGGWVAGTLLIAFALTGISTMISAWTGHDPVLYGWYIIGGTSGAALISFTTHYLGKSK